MSGGCVEGAAAEEIEHARATGNARVIRYGISDEQAWDVGLACGGTIDVLVEPVAPAVVIEAARGSVGAGGHGSAVDHATPRRFATGRVRAARAGRGCAPGGRADRHGRRPADRHARLAGSRRRAGRGRRGRPAPRPVADRRARRPVAVHRGLPGPAAAGRGRWRRGRALARPARPRARLRDRRRRWPAAFATPERFPEVDRLIVGWPDEVAEEIGLGPNDAVAVLSHDVKFDEPAIVEALRRGCRYVGAVGSRKTQADRRAGCSRRA